MTRAGRPHSSLKTMGPTTSTDNLTSRPNMARNFHGIFGRSQCLNHASVKWLNSWEKGKW